MNGKKHGEVTALCTWEEGKDMFTPKTWLNKRATTNSHKLSFLPQHEQRKKAGKRVGRDGGRSEDKKVVPRQGLCSVGTSLEETGA